MLLFSLLVAGVSAWEQKIEGGASAISLSDDGSIGVYYEEGADQYSKDNFALYDKSGKKLWDYSMPSNMEVAWFSSSDNGKYFLMVSKLKIDNSFKADYLLVFLDKDGKEQWRKTYENIECATNSIYFTKIANDGSFFAIRNFPGSIERFNVKGDITYTSADISSQIESFSVTDDGNIIVISTIQGNIKYFNTLTRSEWTYEVSCQSCVDITGDGKYIAVGTASTTSSVKSGIILLDSSGKKIWSTPTTYWVNLIGISNDGEYIIILDDNEKIRCFDKSGNELWSRPGIYFRFAKDQLSVVLVDSDNPDKVALYSIGNAKIMEEMTQYGVGSIQISKNGEFIAVGCKDYLYFYTPSYPTAGLSFSGIESDGSTGNTAQSAPLGLLSVIMSLAIICVLIRNRDDR